MPVRYPDRIRLANLPTPLVRLERLSSELSGARLWVKRDDLTGLELSGNKVRKLEYLLAAALEDGCDTIVTVGSVQSNHCRSTAAACARLGLRAHLVLWGDLPQQPAGNLLLDRLFGAEITHVSQSEYEARGDELCQQVVQAEHEAGRKVRFIPAGGSEPLGCWGYIRAAAELAEQLVARGIDACDVVVPVSTGGTYGGLLLGVLLHRLEQLTIHAVPVCDDVPTHRERVCRLCHDAVQRFEFPIACDESRLSFLDGYVGPGYGQSCPELIGAIRLAAREEGLILDPVYSGKAFWALLDQIRQDRLGRDRPVVFIHTGGAFAALAWGERLVS